MKFSIAAGAMAFMAATAANAVATIPFTVSLESEAPGIQSTTSRFFRTGVEDFERVRTGNGQKFATDFGGSAFAGTYTGVDIIRADQYGGAGGTGQYAVTFNKSGYALDITSSPRGGVTYFGFWLSALDRGNTVSFFQGGKLLFNFTANDARDFIATLPASASYFGNPNRQFAGRNKNEPYAFLNFYARGGTTFDRIVFAENPEVGGYESDNHTVGQWRTMSGTAIPIPGSNTSLIGPGPNVGVPEPASWLMLITGFGLVGAGMRRRRLAAA